MVLVTMLSQVVPGFENGELIAIALFGATGLVAVWWGVVNVRDGFDIWSHDPVDAAAVRHESGVVEVSGTATPLHDTVTAPYSNEDCLAYEYERKERRDDIHDDDDNTSEWRTVESGEESIPFLVEDDSGSVPVDPDGADVSMSDTDYSSSTRTKQIEGRLDPGETVHVFGHKHTDGDGALSDEPVHVGDGNEVNYRIADTSGGRAVLRLFAKGTGAVVFGAVFLAIAGFVLTNGFP
jgi:hypothetical protein